MSKTSLEIDRDLLEKARRILATATVKETVHEALCEVLRMHARREEAAVLTEMRGLDLDDPEVMAGAWRS